VTTEYLQNYNPTGHAALSTLLAAGPVLTLLYLLALHPTRQKDGTLHKGIAAHKAAMIAVAVAFLIATLVFRMPWPTAGMSMVYGGLYGLFPIGWIIIAAMFLYTITLENGTFETVKNSAARLSADRRVQAILIAFSFGAFMEGAAGFGTPVAISGALMVGLGFRARDAAILCLIANTAPVAYGALGTPITALSTVTGIDPTIISRMAARQLPVFSLIVPVWMTIVQVKMARGRMREVWEVWPALLVAGGSFAATQFLVGNYLDYHLVDIAGGLVSMFAVAALSRVWTPATVQQVVTAEAAAAAPVHTGHPEPDLRDEGGISAVAPIDYESRPPRTSSCATPAAGPTSNRLLLAWMPWAILVVLVFLWGYAPVKARLDSLPGTVIKWQVPEVQGHVFRMPPVVADKTSDKAEFLFNWLSASGTGIFIAALLAGLFSGMSASMWWRAVVRTATRLFLPLTTIGLILSMGFVTKYSGMDAVLGLAFTKTGVMYPFFAAMLGWLGVALTGSDTASNVMFGSMQRITAERLSLPPVLIVTANSTGGVMGKMIDAQSIVVATVACYEDRKLGKMEAGPIFRAVFPHSLALAILVGVLVMLQAYWWTWMIPK
jgi:lactate permease